MDNFKQQIEPLKGATIVGYRYGNAPFGDISYNTMSEKYECGLSMARVGNLPEVLSFAVGAMKQAKAKRHYFIGKIAGMGGDNEICLTEAKEITYREYLEAKKRYAKASNALVDAYSAYSEIDARRCKNRKMDDSESEDLPTKEEKNEEVAARLFQYKYTIVENMEMAAKILGIKCDYTYNMDCEQMEEEARDLVRRAAAKLRGQQ